MHSQTLSSYGHDRKRTKACRILSVSFMGCRHATTLAPSWVDHCICVYDVADMMSIRQWMCVLREQIHAADMLPGVLPTGQTAAATNTTTTTTGWSTTTLPTWRTEKCYLSLASTSIARWIARSKIRQVLIRDAVLWLHVGPPLCGDAPIQQGSHHKAMKLLLVGPGVVALMTTPITPARIVLPSPSTSSSFLWTGQCFLRYISFEFFFLPPVCLFM